MTGLRNVMPTQTAFQNSFDNEDKPTGIDKESNTVNNFLPGPNKDNDKEIKG